MEMATWEFADSLRQRYPSFSLEERKLGRGHLMQTEENVVIEASLKLLWLSQGWSLCVRMDVRSFYCLNKCSSGSFYNKLCGVI